MSYRLNNTKKMQPHARTFHARNATKACSCRNGRNTPMSATCGTSGNATRAAMPSRLSSIMKQK